MDKAKSNAPAARTDAEGAEATIPPTTLVRNHVLAKLGRPPYLLRIQVTRLWENTYRANVLVGKSFDTAQCLHSYFLETAESGEILNSTPKLIRVYT